MLYQVTQTISRRFVQAISCALTLCALMAATAFANVPEKTFDFGPGSENPTFVSHSRTFSAPANVEVTATVTYQRAGNTDIPLRVELVKDDDPAALRTNNLTGNAAASRDPQNTTLRSRSASYACGGSTVWRVRVATLSGQAPPARLFGNIRFSFTDPNAARLDMEGTVLDLNRGNSATRRIYGISAQPGALHLKAKWHAFALVPNTFVSLRIELLRNGQAVESGSYYSIHSDKSPKFDLRYNIAPQDVAANWSLRITNNSAHDIKEFNIEKGGDINPFVPNFSSTFLPQCVAP